VQCNKQCVITNNTINVWKENYTSLSAIPLTFPPTSWQGTMCQKYKGWMMCSLNT
jgi:hypothetical protein